MSVDHQFKWGNDWGEGEGEGTLRIHDFGVLGDAYVPMSVFVASEGMEWGAGEDVLVHCEIKEFGEVIRDHNVHRIRLMSRHLVQSSIIHGCKALVSMDSLRVRD